MISIFMTPSFYLPGITTVQKFVRRQFRGTPYGVGERAMERGGESVIASSIMHLIGLAALAAGRVGDEEKEEEIYQESSRWFLPFFINLAIEASRGKPENALRAYSQTAYKALDIFKGRLQWAGILAEDED